MMLTSLTHIWQELIDRITPDPINVDESVGVTKMQENIERLDRVIETRYGRDVLHNMVLNRETNYHALPDER